MAIPFPSLLVFSSSTLQDRVIPEVVPGFIVGIVCLIVFLVFLGWVIYQYCTCCCSAACCRACFSCCHKKKSAPADPNSSQFITEGQTHEAPDPVVIAEEGTAAKSAEISGIEDSPEAKPIDEVTTSPPKSRFPKFTIELVEKILIVVLTLATVACALWGIQTSLTSTDSQISGIWDLVDSISGIVANTTTSLNTLSGQLETLKYSVAAISNETVEIGGALTPFGVTGDVISAGIAALQQGASGINTTKDSISAGVNALNQYVAAVSMQNIDNTWIFCHFLLSRCGNGGE